MATLCVIETSTGKFIIKRQEKIKSDDKVVEKISLKKNGLIWQENSEWFKNFEKYGFELFDVFLPYVEMCKLAFCRYDEEKNYYPIDIPYGNTDKYEYEDDNCDYDEFEDCSDIMDDFFKRNLGTMSVNLFCRLYGYNDIHHCSDSLRIYNKIIKSKASPEILEKFKSFSDYESDDDESLESDDESSLESDDDEFDDESSLESDE